MPKQVFISYSQRDEAAYSLLCTAIDAVGIRRWDVKTLPVGEPLAAGLREAVSQCDLCVFIATAQSVESRWCLAELGAFWGAGKRVIIFMADPSLEDSALPPQFQGNLWTRDAVRVIRSIHDAADGSVRTRPDGFALELDGRTLNVLLGRIEEVDCAGAGCVVMLPANEYFDDACIFDAGSSLGAFMQRHFSGRIEEIQALVRAQLRHHDCTELEKTPHERAPSYGIGCSILLDHPFGTPLRIGLVSVTTQRADAGLRADAADIFAAAESIQRLMANHRLTRVFVPLLGSGHGGLRSEVALLCMLLAFADQQVVRSVRDVNIVVFRAGPESPPVISEASIRRTLELAHSVLT